MFARSAEAAMPHAPFRGGGWQAGWQQELCGNVSCATSLTDGMVSAVTWLMQQTVDVRFMVDEVMRR
jgi:hypothetical protein